MYFIDGDEYPVEMLDGEQASAVLAGLHADAARAAATGTDTTAIVLRIREVRAWIDYLTDEADAAAAEEAAAEHAAAVFADELAHR